MRYLDRWHITLLLEPHSASSCRSLPLSLLSFLLHTCSTTRQIMQQDCQLGIPPPSPCLAFLTLSLSVSLLSFFPLLTPSLPLSLSRLVSLITIQQTAAVESAER